MQSPKKFIDNRIKSSTGPRHKNCVKSKTLLAFNGTTRLALKEPIGGLTYGDLGQYVKRAKKEGRMDKLSGIYSTKNRTLNNSSGLGEHND